ARKRQRPAMRLGDIHRADFTHRQAANRDSQALRAEPGALAIRAGLLAHKRGVELTRLIAAGLMIAAPDLARQPLPRAHKLATRAAVLIAPGKANALLAATIDDRIA